MIFLYQNKDDHEVHFCVSTMNFHVIYDIVYNFHIKILYIYSNLKKQTVTDLIAVLIKMD